MANVQRLVALPQQSVGAGLEHGLALVGLLDVYDLRALHLGVPGPRQHPFGDSMYISHHSGHLRTQTNKQVTADIRIQYLPKKFTLFLLKTIKDWYIFISPVSRSMKLS